MGASGGDIFHWGAVPLASRRTAPESISFTSQILFLACLSSYLAMVGTARE